MNPVRIIARDRHNPERSLMSRFHKLTRERQSQPCIGNDANRRKTFKTRQTTGKRRVIRQGSPNTNHNSIMFSPQLMSVAPGLRASYPLTATCCCRNFPIQTGCHLQGYQRLLDGFALYKADIPVKGFTFTNAFNHFDTSVF